MSDVSRFWQAVELLPGLAAVEAEWGAALGADFVLARPLLRARGERAESYPRPGGGLPYEVVPHGDDDFVGVCRESSDTITLTKDQLVVFELDRRLLADRLAAALGIDRTGADNVWDGRVLHVGHFTSAADARYACFLAFPLESADVHVISARLIADRQAPLVLLVPTRKWVRRVAETTLRHNESVLVPLVEAVTASRPGHFRAVKSLDSLVARATGVIGAPATSADADQGKNVFRLDGDFWTLRFADKTVRARDNLGLKYIARVLEAKGREIDAVVLRSVVGGHALVKPSAGMEILDPQAFRAYKATVEDLTEQLDQAREFNDIAKQEQIQAKLSVLAEQIGSARGLGGRTRKVKDEASNARTAVKNAITRAIERQIRKPHPDLARHFDVSIRTGQSLCYEPVPDVEWEL